MTTIIRVSPANLKRNQETGPPWGTVVSVWFSGNPIAVSGFGAVINGPSRLVYEVDGNGRHGVCLETEAPVYVIVGGGS